MSQCLKSCCSCLPKRHLQTGVTLVGLMICYLMRVSVTLALNEMTQRLNNTKANSTEGPVGTTCPLKGLEVNQTQPKKQAKSSAGITQAKSSADDDDDEDVWDPKVISDEPENVEGVKFQWDQETQHHIIEALYIGYIAAQIPAGILADKFGGKHVFGAGLLVSSGLSISFPSLARTSPWALFAGRVIQGFGQGVMLPSMNSLIAKWTPPNERATTTGIIQTGVMFGNAFGYSVSGLILSAFNGWEPLFYICGALGLVWCLGWYSLCYSSPADHPFISDKEKTMIESQISETSREKPKSIPWSSMLTSLPFMSTIMVNFAHAWALFTIINEMPAYLGKVLQLDIKQCGFFSATPHLGMIPTTFVAGHVADWLRNNNCMSITTNRKVFSILANTLPIPFMLLASFAGCDSNSVNLLFMGMMFFKGLSYSSTRANPVDLSPNYAGVMMAIMNGSGALAGVLSPALVPMLITGDGNIEEWRKVFYVAAGVMATFSLPFLCFGSGEVQPWNHVESDEDHES